MRAIQRQNVQSTLQKVIDGGRLPPGNDFTALRMAVRETSKGRLRDLADCAAHDRDRGHAHAYLSKLAHDFLHAWQNGGRFEIKVANPIKTVLNELNRCLREEGITLQLDPRNIEHRRRMAYGFALALHGTVFELQDGRKAYGQITPVDNAFMVPMLFIEFPELAAPGDPPRPIGSPWMLDPVEANWPVDG